MRLESGHGADAPLVLILRFHYLVVALVALCGVLVWVPAPALAEAVARPGMVLVSLYLWQVAGMQLMHCREHAEPADARPGLLVFLALPLTMAVLAVLVDVLAGLVVLIGALLLLYQPERAPSLAHHWPRAWVRSRYQQTQLLGVALASMGVHVWYAA